MRNPYHHHHHHHHHHNREKKRSVAGETASVPGSFHGSSDCPYISPFFAARSASAHHYDGLIDPPLPSQAQPTWCQSYLNKPRLLRLGSSNSTEDQPTAAAWTHSSSSSPSSSSASINVQYIIGGEGVVGRGSVFGGHGDVEFDPTREPDGPGMARPRARARRGQATDPHSIAERLRRERIAERMKALQEMVPSANKSDKASVLDEIIEYVKFLQLQVKVLSLSRAADGHVQISQRMAADKGRCEGDGGVTVAEGHVARLIEEEDMGSAMAFLQAKGLCLMPIALANAISSKASRPDLALNGLYRDMASGHYRRDMPGGHCHELQGFSITFDQSGLNGVSSSSSCIGTADGDSATNLDQAQQQQQWP